MKKRELFKVWKFEGRVWQLGKFDAMTGSYIAYKLMAEILPMGLSKKLSMPTPSSGKMMSKVDFFDLQADCLRVCCEDLPAGMTPVINSEGNFAVMELEHDAKTVLALTIQVLVWNLTDFFDASLLDSLQESFQDLKLPTA